MTAPAVSTKRSSSAGRKPGERRQRFFTADPPAPVYAVSSERADKLEADAIAAGGKPRRYKLFEKQKAAWKILEDPAKRRILFDGGARSGKTDVYLVWLIKEALTIPGARILIARFRANHARTTIWEGSLPKILPPGTAGAVYSTRNHDMQLHFPNGSVIRVAGLDDQDRVDKILGDEYLHIFIDEATQVSWQTITTVVTRLSQELPEATARKLLLACNPKSPKHWLHQVGIQNVIPTHDAQSVTSLPDADNWARLSWTPYDNPYLPADTIASLEALPDVMRRRMLLGEWCSAEGAVYEMFDEAVHVFDALPAGAERWRRWRAFDFGFTNPFCCLWAAIDPDGRIWVYRELYATKRLVKELAAEIIDAEPGDSFNGVADSADAEARETLRRAGIYTEPAKKAITAGIQEVQRRLQVAGDGRPRLMIHESCAHTIAEAYSYVWEQTRDGRPQKEIPRQVDDHAMDALRYLCMALADPAIHAVEAPSAAIAAAAAATVDLGERDGGGLGELAGEESWRQQRSEARKQADERRRRGGASWVDTNGETVSHNNFSRQYVDSDGFGRYF